LILYRSSVRIVIRKSTDELGLLNLADSYGDSSKCGYTPCLSGVPPENLREEHITILGQISWEDLEDRLKGIADED
jgi:hypothetical protein